MAPTREWPSESPCGPCPNCAWILEACRGARVAVVTVRHRADGFRLLFCLLFAPAFIIIICILFLMIQKNIENQKQTALRAVVL